MIEEGFLGDDLSILRPVRELHEVSHDPDAEPPGGAARRTPAARSTCSASTATRLTSSSRTGSVLTPTTAPERSSCGGCRCSTTSMKTRTASPDSSTGSPSGRSSKATELATGSCGRTQGSSSSTCSTPMCAPTRGSTSKLAASGRMEQIIDDDAVDRAVHDPPVDTRAWFRGGVRAPVRESRGSGVLGLGHLRCARAALLAARPDARAAPRHQESRRRAPRQVRDRRGAGRLAHRLAIADSRRTRDSKARSRHRAARGFSARPGASIRLGSGSRER